MDSLPPLPAPVTVAARAKINAYLRIGPRRPDGYHDLASVFQILELADTLEFTLEHGRDELNLRCTDPLFPDAATNLVARAYRLLRERFADRIATPGVICRVDKQIPMGAGLGGGSADAAATLVGLNRLWNLELDAAELRELGLELGSDVPFILLGGTAFGTGRGEELTPLPPLPAEHLILLVPPFGVSTAEAFGWWDAANPTVEPLPVSELEAHWGQAILEGAWRTFLHNDFEDVVCHHIAPMQQLRATLRNRGLPVVLTGSGSALVGLCPDYDTAARIVQGWSPIAGERLILTRIATGAGVQFAATGSRG